LSEDPDHRPAARAHVAVEVGDGLPTLEAQLQAAQIECTALEAEGRRLVFCHDPAGNRWELRGYL
jgi:catechol 2,3-dioxygenase-like lactoylglutathione lyase family enzyme